MIYSHIGKASQDKFICRAQFVHKAIQSDSQLYKITIMLVKSIHKTYDHSLIN